MPQLRSISADVWMSVTGIAKGREPDEYDRFVLSTVADSMRSEIDMIGFVRSGGVGTISETKLFMGAAWLGSMFFMPTVRALNVDNLDTRADKLSWLADCLDRVAQGDKFMAGAMVPLARSVSVAAGGHR